jgi:hypothetical protein
LGLFTSLWASISGRVSGRPGPAESDTPTGPVAPVPDSFGNFADDLRDSLDVDADWDASGPEALFAGIASNYAQPIKDFVFDLKRGTATKDWVEICMPVLGSLLHGAQSLELPVVSARMIDFRDALAAAEMSEGRAFDAESQQLILQRYDALVEALPSTFDPGTENRRRESIIIHSLLRQIPEVGHVSFEKLYGSGLTSLEVLFMANPKDMSVTTSIPMRLCELICGKLNDHRQQLESSEPSDSKTDHHVRLEQLVQELKLHHERLQRVANESRVTPESVAEKRECLRLRQTCGLKIDVLLAEMGEVDLVEKLRKLAVERRIERLQQHLGPSVVTATSASDATQASPNNPEGSR